uniref:Uncharacterized protein n=1 Tax=Ditylenchus dipsaci TaxID=166011 RepID=A0A915D5L9_9BILA
MGGLYASDARCITATQIWTSPSRILIRMYPNSNSTERPHRSQAFRLGQDIVSSCYRRRGLQLHSDKATPKSSRKRHHYNAAVKLDAIYYTREKHIDSFDDQRRQ